MITAAKLWDRIRRREAIVPRFSEIPLTRTLNGIPQDAPIRPGLHYFAIVVDELFLADSRQWLREFDPVVLAITEFVYGSKQITLPFLIGPRMLGEKVNSVPRGMLYKGTRVAGVHPFRGGRIVSTMVLCQVRRHDYSKQLVTLVESMAAAVPFGGELGTYTRFAETLMTGIDSLLGAGDTAPLVGVRQEFDYDLGNPMRPRYFALIDAPEGQFPLDHLWVRDASLLVGKGVEELVPLRQASYVLFSTRGAVELTEIQTLPLYGTVSSIIELAASPVETDWKRAKAELVVLLRQLLTSPDLTREQALRFHEYTVQQAQEAHVRASSIDALGTRLGSVAEDELRAATKLLDM